MQQNPCKAKCVAERHTVINTEISRNQLQALRVYLCGFQRVGDNRSVGRRLVSPADISVTAGAKAGPLPACPEETTGSADEDDGQCGHVLHAVDAVHLHFQVYMQN